MATVNPYPPQKDPDSGLPAEEAAAVTGAASEEAKAEPHHVPVGHHAEAAHVATEIAAEPLAAQVAPEATTAQVIPEQIAQALNRDGAVLKNVENVLIAAESVSPEAGRQVAAFIGQAVEASQQHLAALTNAPEAPAAAIDGAAAKPLETPVPAPHRDETTEAAPHHAAEEIAAVEKPGFADKLTPRAGHAAAVTAEVKPTLQVG